MATLTLSSRRVLMPDGRLAPATVTARDGIITSLSEGAPSDPNTVDLGDDALLPALTDTHVHLNEPGRTEWEGFYTGSRAAAAGGVTLLVDMPLNSIPVTTTADALEQKIAAARGQLQIDCAFWGGVIPGNELELAPMARRGVYGFKAFLCPSGIDEFPAASERDLLRAMPVLRDSGVPLLVHAELEAELAQIPAGEPSEYRRYLHSRPKEWEDRAVALVIDLVARTGCRAHIVHLSSSGSLPLLRAAKAHKLPITAETCPHYLGLCAEEVPRGATEFKCAPPVRERDNQDALWAALRDGTLDFVVTDHSPCIPSLKKQQTGDFLEAWGGIASLQLGARSVWTAARRRGIDLATMWSWMSHAPAGWLGLPERGQISRGAVADLVRFRLTEEIPLDPRELLHKHPTTPWAGRGMSGQIVTTWMRGEPVWSDGQIVGAARGAVRLKEAR